MANTIRIKRRASTGQAGAPTTLAPAELAYNENDNILYYGYGDGGSGLASSVISVAGSGGFVTTNSNQTVSGAKTFSNITISGGSISGITDLAVADGGTGASTASSARSNLGAAASGANSDITSLSGLTTALSVAQGGTGSTTALGARVNLLPTLTGNAEKVIAVDANGTDIEYVTRVKAIAFNPPSSLFVDSNNSSFNFSSAPVIGFSLINQAANKVFAGPTTGANDIPTFRTLVAGDIPALSYLPLAGGTVSGALVVTGNLTVNGTTTTVSSSTLTIADKNIELATGSNTDAAANGGGITLHGLSDKTFNWVSTTSSWTSSENLDLASGKVLKINGTTVLSATALDGVDINGGTF